MNEYEKAWADIHTAQSLGEPVPAGLLTTLNSKMPEPKVSLPEKTILEISQGPVTAPSREKGLVVHFGPKEMAEGIFSGRFIYSAGINGKKDAVDKPDELINLFLNQDESVKQNGIWLVVTNLDAYSTEELEMIMTFEKLCKENKVILFKTRGKDLPGGWVQIN